VFVAEIQIQRQLGVVGRTGIGTTHEHVRARAAVAEDAQRFKRERQHRIARNHAAFAQADRGLQCAVDQRRMQHVGGVVLVRQTLGQRQFAQHLAVAAVETDDAAVRGTVFDADLRIGGVDRVRVPMIAGHRGAHVGQVERHVQRRGVDGVVETHATGSVLGAVSGRRVFAEHTEFEAVVTGIDVDQDRARAFDRERRQPQHVLEGQQRAVGQFRHRIDHRRAGHFQIGHARQHADRRARGHPHPMVAEEEFAATQMRAIALLGQGRDVAMHERMQLLGRRPAPGKLSDQLQRAGFSEALAFQLAHNVFDEIHHDIPFSRVSWIAASCRESVLHTACIDA
jgi:hypothetical protein